MAPTPTPKTPKSKTNDNHQKALRLKTLAESKYTSTAAVDSALKYATRAHRLCPTLPGISSLLTAFTILNSNPPEYYSILNLQPFSSLTSIKAHYKKLALLLHPDKCSLQTPSSDAFKLVNDAFRVLSDRALRKDYDTKLRIALQSQNLEEQQEEEEEAFCNHGEGSNSVMRSDRVRVRVSGSRIDGKEEGLGGKKSKLIDHTKRRRGEEEEERELTLAEIKLQALKKKKKKGKKEDKKRVKIREESEMKTGRRVQPFAGSGDMEVMTVVDSDFYDFDEDRVERSFKKGQVWAIYDDDDGMPRHYGLIDEVVCFNPFQVKMSWLDAQSRGDDELVSFERMGLHVSCGRFKVARKDTINLLNIFSHLVECERAARELYRIYPRKGSVWALYKERSSTVKGGEDSSSRDKRCYDIVVLLTSYSEMHGLSMAYLEKVAGFRAVFRRQEIGCQAIRWVEKDDTRLFSHQIPARKLSENEAPNLSCDCWELDPASLPSNLLAITRRE